MENCCCTKKNKPLRSKNSDNCFDVTMGTYNGAKVCELVGTLILSTLANSIPKENCSLYRDDGLIVMRNENGLKTDRITKGVFIILKVISFEIEIKTNLKFADCLDITCNLSRGT